MGAVVGAVLFLALRFVVGSTVVAGLGARSSVGLPRRYVDYLPTAESLGVAPALPVAVGTGLVAGLLVGVVLRFAAARRAGGHGRPMFVVTLAVTGFVVGVLVAVELHAYGLRPVPRGDFGWYAYSPLNTTAVDGVLYGGGSPPSSWWPLALAGAIVGLLVGSVAACGLLVAARFGARRA